MARKVKQNIVEDFLILDNETPFAIQEAYKTLRTNIMFSLPGEKCKKIIFSSAAQKEGKSATTVNLALAFAKTKARVMLIDCDLRLPTIHLKLDIPQKPGLTNLLYGLSETNAIIQHLPSGLDVITSGDIPSNPSETLGSDRMEKMLDILSNHYDYILIDTPPICTVTDAAILSRAVSGVVLVAQKGIAEYKKISEALNLFKMADAHLLGFIFTGTEIARKKYRGKYSRYGKYGRYGYGYYGYGYDRYDRK